MKKLWISIVTVQMIAFGCAHTVTNDLPQGLLTGEHGRIVRIANGELISPRDALSELATYEAIYAAESHDNEAHHEIQELLVQGLLALGVRPTLAFEMLQEKDQKHLDAYVAGTLSEDQFLDRIQWSTSWGYPFKHYRALFRAAREHSLEAIAINADRNIVRAIAKGGKEGLTPSQEATCPPLDSGTDAHRAYIKHFFKGHGAHGHGHSGGNFERFYQAQLVWDETMARNVKAATARSKGPVIVFAGKGHVEFAHGIPSRASHSGDDFVIIVPLEKGTLHKQHKSLRVLSYPTKKGDFFWEASSEPTPLKGVHGHGSQSR